MVIRVRLMLPNLRLLSFAKPKESPQFEVDTVYDQPEYSVFQYAYNESTSQDYMEVNTTPYDALSGYWQKKVAKGAAFTVNEPKLRYITKGQESVPVLETVETEDAIVQLRGAYFGLSNIALLDTPIVMDGQAYNSTENAFQAAKYRAGSDIRTEFASPLANPKEMKNWTIIVSSVLIVISVSVH